MGNIEVFSNRLRDASKADAELIKEYSRGYEYRGATYTFLANYLWKNDYEISWEVINGYLCMASIFSEDADDGEDEPSGLIAMPMTKTGNYDAKTLGETLKECKSRFEKHGMDFNIFLVPEHMKSLLKEAVESVGLAETGKVEFYHSDDYDEYVYEKEKLISLSGRNLHKKKNHLNYFLKTYKYEAKPLSKEMLPEILRITEIVRADRERSDEEVHSLASEKNAIKEAMNFLDDEDVYSVGVYIDGVLQAYAIGEYISEDTAVEHFEKANPEIRGLYQAVCSEFCKALPENICFVNREEDMGIENLRRAKQALRPHHMERKLSCKIGRASCRERV